VTDASGINLSYDLRLLPVDQIESIEIMKGAASTLYGSEQLRCYHITLKKADKKSDRRERIYEYGTQVVAKENSTKINDFNQGFSLMVSLKSSIILLL
jgi:vitamin B12 transporter